MGKDSLIILVVTIMLGCALSAGIVPISGELIVDNDTLFGVLNNFVLGNFFNESFNSMGTKIFYVLYCCAISYVLISLFILLPYKIAKYWIQKGHGGKL